MKLLGRASAAILCGLTLGAAFGQSAWKGNYAFTEDGGRNGGGSTMVVTHRIKVFETRGGLRARLTSNGYETSRDLNCSAKVKGNKLSLFFESYGPDNVYDTQEEGDLMVTLERRTVRGRPAIVTYWGKLTPIVIKNKRQGRVYFTRS